MKTVSRGRPVALIAAFVLVMTAGCGQGGGSGQAEQKPVTQGGQSGSGADSSGTGLPQLADRSAAPSAAAAKAQAKYLGLYVEQPASISAQLAGFKRTLGKRPNIVKSFTGWNSGYNQAWATSVKAAGAIPQLEWEPHGQNLKDIAAGRSDAYVTSFARDVKRAGVPIVLSFGHEFNGWWYDWGTRKATAAEFVAAWKHIHKIFERQGASNVKWMWSPNAVFPMPQVKLKPYYPGDAYVDWVGVIGYYRGDPRYSTFDTIFTPTFDQIATFTKRPVLLSEVGAIPGKGRAAAITGLLSGVAARDNVIGLIWFNVKKEGGAEADWRIQNSAVSLATFKRYVNEFPYGAK
jgi:hypothetical protein